MQNVQTKLFLYQLQLFKDFVTALSYMIISPSVSLLDQKMPIGYYQKAEKVEKLTIFYEIEQKINAFDKEPNYHQYMEIVELVKKMYLHVYEHYEQMSLEQDVFTQDVFKGIYDTKLKRHKHLFKHFLLGLKVMVPVEDHDTSDILTKKDDK